MPSLLVPVTVRKKPIAPQAPTSPAMPSKAHSSPGINVKIVTSFHDDYTVYSITERQEWTEKSRTRSAVTKARSRREQYSLGKKPNALIRDLDPDSFFWPLIIRKHPGPRSNGKSGVLRISVESCCLKALTCWPLSPHDRLPPALKTVSRQCVTNTVTLSRMWESSSPRI